MLNCSVIVYFLCFSRVFQGAAASLLWIISMATIADTVGSAHMGKTMGIIGPIFSAGALFGPMIGGLLLSSVGYWHTWIAALVMISLDLLLRLAMIDRPKPSAGTPGADTVPSDEARIHRGPFTTNLDKSSKSNTPEASCAAVPPSKSPCSKPSSRTSAMPSTSLYPISTAAEATPLLYTFSQPLCPPPPAMEPLSNAGYFLCILRQKRVMSSALITIMLSIVWSSFNTTLALHVQDVFHWGPRQVGFLFLALVLPSVLLGPLAGWVRDRVGVRWPAVAGTSLATPLFFLMGHVGDERFPSMRGELGKAICVGVVILMGFAIELTESICIVEGSRM